jgi:hypothetical protein
MLDRSNPGEIHVVRKDISADYVNPKLKAVVGARWIVGRVTRDHLEF